MATHMGKQHHRSESRVKLSLFHCEVDRHCWLGPDNRLNAKRRREYLDKVNSALPDWALHALRRRKIVACLSNQPGCIIILSDSATAHIVNLVIVTSGTFSPRSLPRWEFLLYDWAAADHARLYRRDGYRLVSSSAILPNGTLAGISGIHLYNPPRSPPQVHWVSIRSIYHQVDSPGDWPAYVLLSGYAGSQP